MGQEKLITGEAMKRFLVAYNESSRCNEPCIVGAFDTTDEARDKARKLAAYGNEVFIYQVSEKVTLATSAFSIDKL